MTRNEVYELCKLVAPLHDLEPLLVLAVCAQESGFDEKAIRLENGFYRRYVMPKHFAASTGVLLSASYGLMQTMGMTLFEQGFFDGCTTAQVSGRIDEYINNPRMQLEYGCDWLRSKIGKGTIQQGLLKYNGGGNPEYSKEVMQRYNQYWEEKL